MAFTKTQLDAYIQALYDNDGQLSSEDYQLIINYILSNGEPDTKPRDLIQIRRGNEADLPVLAIAELAFTTDTLKLFIGGISGNEQINKTVFLDVKNFGAKGDGATNDTDAIQAAIDFAELLGATITFPYGTYLVDTLRIQSNIELLGDKGATLKQRPYTGNLINLSGTSKSVAIRNLSFDGNRLAQAAKATNNTIFADDVEGTPANPFVLRIENCVFRNQCFSSVNYYGNFTATGEEFIYIQNNEFYGGNEGDASAYDCKYISINDGCNAIVTENIFDLQNAPTGAGIAGIVMASTSSVTEAYTNATIENNQFKNVGRIAANPLGAIDFYIYGKEVSITGNKIYSAPSTAIKGKSNSKNVNIAGNFVDGAAIGIGVTASTTAIANENFIVEGNTVKNTTQIAMTFDGLPADLLKNLVICNNILNNVNTQGIEVIRVDGLVITGNVIDGSTGVGIGFRNCQNDVIIGLNIIKNTGSFGVYAESAITSCRVSLDGNHINQATTYGIYLQGVDVANVRHNVMRGKNAGDVGLYLSTAAVIVVVTVNFIQAGSDMVIPLRETVVIMLLINEGISVLGNASTFIKGLEPLTKYFEHVKINIVKIFTVQEVGK
jgi:hypothetical protein